MQKETQDNLFFKDFLNLHSEVYYLRFIISKVVESSEELKCKIDQKTFEEARQFAMNEVRHKFQLEVHDEKKEEEKPTL